MKFTGKDSNGLGENILPGDVVKRPDLEDCERDLQKVRNAKRQSAHADEQHLNLLERLVKKNSELKLYRAFSLDCSFRKTSFRVKNC